MPSDFLQYLIVGSYLMGAGSWAFLYKEIRSCRREIEHLSTDLAYYRGKYNGLDLDTRVTRLEHPL